MNLALKKMHNLLERIDTQYRDYALLTESQESKSIAAAKKLVMQRFGWNEARADEFVRKELRHDFSVLHHNSKAGKFILGLTRMFCDNQLSDGGTIQQLNRTLELVASDTHINEYDRNLNGMSAQDLINRFSTTMKGVGDRDREEVGTLELQENNDYTIVQIDNFEQSSEYGKYTSWCVTHDPGMLDSYTSGGIGQFYFCLKNGFENVPKQEGENCPLDEYGLSMVAVSVDGDGNLNTCTCRWNHDNGGNDNIMDTKQISQLIGRNFYEVFKPNNKLKEKINNILELINEGVPFENIFRQYKEVDSEYVIVQYDFSEDGDNQNAWNFNNMRKNIYNKTTKNFVLKQWFTNIDHIPNTNKFITENDNLQNNIITNTGDFLLPNNVANIDYFTYTNGKTYIVINYGSDKGCVLVDEELRNITNETYDYLRICTDNPSSKYIGMIREKNGSHNLIDINGNRLYQPNDNKNFFSQFNDDFAVKTGTCEMRRYSPVTGEPETVAQRFFSLVFTDGTEWHKWYRHIGRIWFEEQKRYSRKIYVVEDFHGVMHFMGRNEKEITNREILDQIPNDKIFWLRTIRSFRTNKKHGPVIDAKDIF